MCSLAEICNNGIDDDGDGLIDCDDPDCSGAPVCSQAEICNNGIDDDGDGLIDCADPDCSNAPVCNRVEICNNGIDDDGDGLVDCADPDCSNAPICNLAEICDNGIDDDGDGLIDCADPDCTGAPVCRIAPLSSSPGYWQSNTSVEHWELCGNLLASSLLRTTWTPHLPRERVARPEHLTLHYNLEDELIRFVAVSPYRPTLTILQLERLDRSGMGTVLQRIRVDCVPGNPMAYAFELPLSAARPGAAFRVRLYTPGGTHSFQSSRISLPAYSATHLRVYPNPADQLVQLELRTETRHTVQVRLVDGTGKAVLERQFRPTVSDQPLTLDVTGLTPGRYLLIATTPEEQFTRQLIISR